MSKLSVLDSHPVITYQYILCFTSLVSDVEHKIQSIEETLLQMFRVSSKVSDEKTIVGVLMMLRLLRGFFSELLEVRSGLPPLSLLHSL
ncbi:hypothetical protein XFHB_13845 [Xylella fastidiosa]|uniref:Uncharacterized protein n=1 Tax=Xylella fastidiosa TaxID=2371 RepID=A0ABD7BY62_XYLFS|nr:hypothetical protein [Xylella fastidiosa]QPB72590.1 hypothetical protein XFHB_13845 [Xylella fastidiosa]